MSAMIPTLYGKLQELYGDFLCPHTRLLLESYKHWTGCDLMPQIMDSANRAEALFNAPFAVVSHGTQADAVFNYGNQAALDLFAMNWESFTCTPSRESAEPVNREERQRMLEEVTTHGYTDSYQGIRITADGRRFQIPQATVWNLVDELGTYRGQAAMFAEWTFL